MQLYLPLKAAELKNKQNKAKSGKLQHCKISRKQQDSRIQY